MYSSQVTDHFENPRNIGTIPDADGISTIGSAESGEMLNLTLKIVDNIVVLAKFRAFGCPTAIASGSVLTELVSGKNISDAKEITASHISIALGGLPSDTQRFATYAEEALNKAIEDSLSKQEMHQ